MRGGPVRGAALVAALWGAFVPAAAQPASTPPVAPTAGSTTTMVERATVELVLIEVYVTDSHGRPIRDLTADDFALMVDGYPKPIHSLEFREVAAGVPAPSAGSAGTGTAGTPPGTPQSAPRRFILFFEDGLSLPGGLTAARLAADRFVESGLLPGDQVALASYDRKLRILHDFTTDRGALRRTIDTSLHDLNRFTDYASEQGKYERDFADVLAHSGQPTSVANEADGRHLTVMAINYGNEYTSRFRAVLQALTSLVDSLALYPGYKAIVFMGDGVAENPAVDFLQRFIQLHSANMNSLYGPYSLSTQVKQLAHYASAAGVTLHSVQTTGLSSTTTEMRAAGRRSNTLETLALNTGGTTSTSNDLFKALSQAEATSRAYYVIGYAPEGPPDGKYHTVQVRLKHRSGSVRWRRGFTRLLPEQARERAVEAAYFLPELYRDMGIEISAVVGPADGTARVYDLVVHLPPGRALFAPQQEGRTARLDAGFVLIDESQRETLRAAREARITLADPALTGRLGIDFFSRIRVPRGGQTITAVVSDKAAGTLGAARLAIPAADAPAAPGALGLSIYSLSEKSLWIEIPTAGSAGAREDEPADYEIGPALKTSFSVGEPLACGFRLEPAVIARGLRLLIRAGEREVRSVEVEPPAFRSAGARPGAGSVKVTLPLEGLPAGDYLVVVRRKDASGVETDAGSAPLSLRPADGPANEKDS